MATPTVLQPCPKLICLLLPSCDDASVSQAEGSCSFSCVRGAALS
ncbi:hypothetical protein SSAG_06078 [Streptomyces sp. Mg1]|nr:hypothetical protein SSAG_06078 [Streptomyces sp. Mg1]